MRQWLGKLLCWFDWHRLGDAYEFPRYEEPGESVLLARCVRCGALHRLT
jgi:hypothetical protein